MHRLTTRTALRVAIVMPLVLALAVDVGIVVTFPALMRQWFAARSVAAIHLLAAMPLTIGIGKFLRRPSHPNLTRAVGLIVVLMLLWAVLPVSFLAGDDGQMSWALPTIPGRLIARCLIAIGLVSPAGVFPWLLASTSTVNRPVPYRRRHWIGLGWFTVLLVLAIGLPATFTMDLIDRLNQRASELLLRGQLTRARSIVEQLCRLGSEKPLGGVRPAEKLAGLTATIQQCSERLATIDFQAESPHPIIARARLLAVLDRPNEARAALARVAPWHPEAALLMGSIAQSEARFEESSRWYRRGLKSVQAQAPVVDVASLIRAYDALAFNARALGNGVEAEEIYFEAMRAVPDARAYLHFQLGRHYELSGRPWAAVAELQSAAALAPDQYHERAAEIIRRLRDRSPACVLHAQSR